jgi:exodeoxyribonuclease VII large subunit
MQTLGWLRQRLVQNTGHRLEVAHQHCHLLRQKLISLDPEAVLKRGYAVARQIDGTVARSSIELTPGQKLMLQLAQGQVEVTVSEILKT